MTNKVKLKTQIELARALTVTAPATPALPTYDYKGHTIRLVRDAMFIVGINGKQVARNSLQAVKNHIDRLKQKMFKPFKARAMKWVTVHGKNKSTTSRLVPVAVMVTGIKRVGDRYYRIRNGTQFAFVTDPDTNANNKLLADTKENLKRRTASLKFKKETEKIVNQRRAMQRVLDAKIKWIDVKEYV